MSDTHNLQTIEFDGSEGKHFAEIKSDNVVIKSSPGNHDLASSKVTLKNVVDFNWEHKLYLGHVIAVHMLGKYIAYGIKAKSGGMVRVINKDSTIRGIIKDHVGQPQDLAFARIEKEIILASIDEEGNMFVHSIELPDVTCVLKLHIPYSSPSPTMHRVKWCPYIPDDSQGELDEETAKLLVVTHGSKAIMMSVSTIIENYGSKPLENGGVITEGVIEINEHTKAITDAMFAPDGTAIALASGDGEIKFFQVYMHADVKNKPRCLHQWKPHNGKAVSSLFFLDNHKHHMPDVQYWKYALTGCDNNSELKLWSCQTWSCLQKIVIQPNPSMKLMSGNNHVTLKASLDKSAQYLILSDVYNRIMYIIHITKDEKEKLAFMNSVSEFLLPCCILSFDIVSIGSLDYKSINNCQDDLYDLAIDSSDIDNEDMDDMLPEMSMQKTGFNHFRKTQRGVMLKLYLVQPKSLQECRVIYDTQLNNGNTMPMIAKDSFAFRDELEDVSMISNHADNSMLSSSEEKKKQILKDLVSNSNEFNSIPVQQSTPLQMVQAPAPPPSQISLMTPDAFNTLKKDFSSSSQTLALALEPKNEQQTSSEHTLKAFDGSILEAKVSGSPTIMDQKFIDDLMYLGTKRLEEVEPPMATSDDLEYDKKSRDGNFASGGSSPSREVQEILSLKDSRSDLLDFDLIDDGDQELPSGSANISQTLKPLVTKSLNHSEIKIEDNPMEVGWPCPPKLDAQPTVQDSLNNGNASANAIGISKAFASYSSANNISREEDINLPILEKILGTLVQQTKQIQNLQLEVKRLHDNEKALCNKFIESSSRDMENYSLNLENVIQKAFMKNQVQQSNLLETLTNRTSDEVADINRSVSQTIEKLLDKKFLEKFSSNFTLEMQRCIIPSVVSSLDSLKLAVQNDISNKLTTTDNLLRDHVMKFTQDKHTIDLLSKALLAGAQTVLNNTLREHMATSLIPSFERAANQMFKQMHETFIQGTKDCLMNFELSMEKKRHVDKSKEIIVHMDQLSDNLRMHTQATNNINKYIYESISKTMKIMQDNLIKSINENVNLAFRKQSEELEGQLKTAVRSNSVTPSLQANDVFSRQTQINELLYQKDFCGAFQLALMASDLNIVVYVCEKVNPATLFKQTPCALPQPVLLSLIQQLSADLLNHAELKYRYLEEALMSLDTNSQCNQEHLLVVLKPLKKQLTNFISQHPNNSITKGVRMLSMVTDSLLSTVSLNNMSPKSSNISV